MLSEDRSVEPLKIVHVAETVRGGIASYLRDLIPLQVQTFGPGRIAVIVPAEQITDLMLPEGIEIHGFHADYRSTKKRALNGLRLAAATARLLRYRPAENLHIHSTFAGLSVRALTALRHQRPQIIYCPHGWAFMRKSPLNRIARQIERYLSRWTDHIVCVSEHERMVALEARIPSEKLVLIRNGIPIQAPEAADIPSPWVEDNRLKLLFLGRFDRQKGIDTLIEAMRPMGEHAFLCAAGGSVVDEQVPRQLPDNVRLLDWQPPTHISALLALCDALVMPSRWEGMPLTAIEAMRAGRAIIGSDIGGLNELIMDGRTGRLVPVDDAACLTNILSNLTVEQCRQMGQAARTRFEQEFDIRRVHRELLAIYRNRASTTAAP